MPEVELDFDVYPLVMWNGRPWVLFDGWWWCRIDGEDVVMLRRVGGSPVEMRRWQYRRAMQRAVARLHRVVKNRVRQRA